jgi:hypothetical protein
LFLILYLFLIPTAPSSSPPLPSVFWSFLPFKPKPENWLTNKECKCTGNNKRTKSGKICFVALRELTCRELFSGHGLAGMPGRDGWALEMREGDRGMRRRKGEGEGRRGKGRIRMSPYRNFADFQIRAGNNNFRDCRIRHWRYFFKFENVQIPVNSENLPCHSL